MFDTTRKRGAAASTAAPIGVAGGQRAVLVGETPGQFVGGQHLAVVPVDLEMLFEAFDHIRKRSDGQQGSSALQFSE